MLIKMSKNVSRRKMQGGGGRPKNFFEKNFEVKKFFGKFFLVEKVDPNFLKKFPKNTFVIPPGTSVV